MTSFRTHCNRCDLQVVLDKKRAGVRYNRDTEKWSYWFACPKCGTHDEHRTSRLLAQEMIGDGIPVTAWTWPAELDEPHAGPPITLDDLIDLMVELEQGVT